ncbi:MAG: molybdopterin oxidoreductase family protein, partial [Proteobacteria bacterium]|nr:molybdopterin oxidoreductase family protein [Pseudomonadota bacterium]
PKGAGSFEPVSWDDALDLTAEGLLAAEGRHGPEAVWPYYYAGTMGLVMRDGIHRLRNVKRYSGQYSTICVTPASNGYIAGTGKLAGADPREMAKSDCVVIWGTNPVHTQVNVMTHAVRARKERGAKIVHVDIYHNATSEAADMAIILRPGTDGAFACAVMHVLFREGMADRDYLERYTDAPRELEAHLAAKTPQWASRITGVPVAEIEAFARLVGRTPKTYFRLGYGFSRNRNGAVNMHAALCIAAVTGAWRHEGGGAFHNNGAIYHWNKTMIEGLDALDPRVRVLDQSRIGAVLAGDAGALKGGPPVDALFIQNTNPMMVAPDLNVVHRGFARDDLFVCVHEQFMTETANMADVVLPATMFTEHDDLYQGGGHQHIMLGPRVVDAPEGCRSNHEVICALAKRLGAKHPGFDLSVRELIDWTLVNSGWRGLADLEREKWFDVQPAFEAAHYLKGFAWPDGKFRFKADWVGVKPQGFGPADGLPTLPDHHEAIEEPTDEMPFQLATSPARNFLNSSFTETRSSVKREGRPTVLLHPSDASRAGVTEGARVRLGNTRGTVVVHATLFDGVREGVLVVEGIWPNASFEEGIGINALTGADPIGPVGGAAFHDNRVWLRVVM